MSHLDREKVARYLCQFAEGDPDEGTIRPRWQKWLPEADALIEACMVPVIAEGIVLDRAALTQAVGRVLFNTSNYPASAQPYLLGRDISPLRTKVVDSILAQQLEAQL